MPGMLPKKTGTPPSELDPNAEGVAYQSPGLAALFAPTLGRKRLCDHRGCVRPQLFQSSLEPYCIPRVERHKAPPNPGLCDATPSVLDVLPCGVGGIEHECKFPQTASVSRVGNSQGRAGGLSKCGDQSGLSSIIGVAPDGSNPGRADDFGLGNPRVLSLPRPMTSGSVKHLLPHRQSRRISQ
jgi:hypothetical protein